MFKQVVVYAIWSLWWLMVITLGTTLNSVIGTKVLGVPAAFAVILVLVMLYIFWYLAYILVEKVKKNL